MTKRALPVLLLAYALSCNTLFSQARIENKLTFYEAESWVLFEDFKEALPLYLRLLKFFPNNSNIKYRIGQCYINIPGEKDKAVAYLEDAVKNINPDYKEGKFKENGAPSDAFYYLANAYRINNQLDKAITTYENFYKNLDPKIYDTVIVLQQIQSCHNAKELMAEPLFVKEFNLGETINDESEDFNPVVSDDESMMVYSKGLAFYDALLFSEKKNGVWSAPQNLNEALKVDRDIFPTSISNDGKVLYLYSSADYDGIIYSSTYANNTWGPIVKLNDNINTKFWESHATISHDNKKLYFTSNRKGTLGGLDIYVSERDSTGDWGPAINMGEIINSPYNEETPFLSKDDRTLFFSSRGHFNIGGYDIFYSSLLNDGTWSKPLNAGFPVNSTDDDIFFKPVNQGYEGYLSKYSPDGYGKQDLYRLEIFSEQHPRKFQVRGMVKIADLIAGSTDRVRVSVVNNNDPTKSFTVLSDPETGMYQFEVPQGDYTVTYEGAGSEKVTRNLNLELTQPSDSFMMASTVLPKTDFVADLVVESNSTIVVQAGDTVFIPIRIEPDSKLTVEHWVGDSLVHTETFNVSDTTMIYKMVPSGGDSKVTFKLTDKFNNTTSTDIFITREKSLTTRPVIRPEYNRVIASKQIRVLAEMLKNRADEPLKRVITRADIDGQQFGRVDELISFIKEEASKSSINPQEVDKLALKVAVLDNVLTQAAVDYMSNFTEGELKEILDGIDIYDLNLKTWTDLQEYVNKKSGGRISANDLNRIAADIIADKDPSIAIMAGKISQLGEKTGSAEKINSILEVLAKKPLITPGEWLNEFWNEALKQGMQPDEIAAIIASLSAKPGTSVEDYASQLAGYADEPLASFIRSINLRKENIKSPADLILYLINNAEKNNISLESIFKALAAMIAGNDVQVKDVVIGDGDKNKLWYIWIIAGGILVIIFFLARKKKKKGDN